MLALLLLCAVPFATDREVGFQWEFGDTPVMIQAAWHAHAGPVGAFAIGAWGPPNAVNCCRDYDVAFVIDGDSVYVQRYWADNLTLWEW